MQIIVTDYQEVSMICLFLAPETLIYRHTVWWSVFTTQRGSIQTLINRNWLSDYLIPVSVCPRIDYPDTLYHHQVVSILQGDTEQWSVCIGMCVWCDVCTFWMCVVWVQVFLFGCADVYDCIFYVNLICLFACVCVWICVSVCVSECVCLCLCLYASLVVFVCVLV